MNVILLSGGSGKRLWPLSNDVRSKQFLQVLDRGDGKMESMAQRVCRMLREVDQDVKIIIATSGTQVSQIETQLGKGVEFSIEPERRDTFPAIALAAAYLKKHGTNPLEPVVVCPVDPYVGIDYFKAFAHLVKETQNTDLVLMGVEPTEPSEKYGYIIPETTDFISNVIEFKEKPKREQASKYIDQGALWNCGVFAFQLKYVLNIAVEMFGTDDYDSLYKNYDTLRKISFDYAVVERESNIRVLRFKGQWKDIGSWDTLTEVMNGAAIGDVIMGDCENTYVLNELPTQMIVLGLENTVVAATPDGILVSRKNCSEQLKNYVRDRAPMYEEGEWGEYSVIAESESGKDYRVKKVSILPGSVFKGEISQDRKIVYTVLDGHGQLISEGQVTPVSQGDSIEKSGPGWVEIGAVVQMTVLETSVRRV